MTREPVAIINSITAAIEAIILAVVTFGVNLSGEQIAAIMGAVIAVGTVIQTTMARNRVFAPSTVETVVANAVSDFTDWPVDLDDPDAPALDA